MDYDSTVPVTKDHTCGESYAVAEDIWDCQKAADLVFPRISEHNAIYYCKIESLLIKKYFFQFDDVLAGISSFFDLMGIFLTC